MNRLIFIIIINSLCYTQSTGYSLYGIGEKTTNIPAPLSMGNSIFFSGNTKNISINSPSTLWRSALTRFSIGSGINILNTKELPEQFNHNLTFFALHFPVGNKKVIGFGLQPVFRTNKLEIVDKDFKFIGSNGNSMNIPMATKNFYSIDGGISSLFLEYSLKLSNTLSCGIKYSFLFGNQYIYNELYTYDIVIDTMSTGINLIKIDTLYAKFNNEQMTSLQKYQKFSGSILTFDGRYKREKQALGMRISFSGKMNIETRSIQTTNNSSSINKFMNSSNMILYELGIGYQYKIKDNFGISFEIHKNYPFNIPIFFTLFNTLPPEENSLHLGYCYSILNSKIGYWNTFNLRGGVYYKDILFPNITVMDYGLTLGFGIEYLSNMQSIDFALRVGKKESILLYGEYENYTSFHIMLTSGERWFMKSRRK